MKGQLAPDLSLGSKLHHSDTGSIFACFRLIYLMHSASEKGEILMRRLSIFVLFLIIVSCHPKSSSTGDGLSEMNSPRLQGRYQSYLTALNTSVSGFTQSVVDITIRGDQFSATVEVKDGPSLSYHSQNIYLASRCPDDSIDYNEDGFVDSLEASSVLGNILLPLDEDLTSQELGLDQWPLSDGLGNYFYHKESDLSLLLADLFAEDINPNDLFIKLKRFSSFNFEGKVVVIAGIPDDSYIPGSVMAREGESERRSLPIACGYLRRVIESE